jgi:hypothetical protein
LCPIASALLGTCGIPALFDPPMGVSAIPTFAAIVIDIDSDIKMENIDN